MIIGILPLLVTALIRWNVYSLIDLKTHIDQSRRKESELKELKKKAMMVLQILKKILQLVGHHFVHYHEKQKNTFFGAMEKKMYLCTFVYMKIQQHTTI